LGLRTLKNIYPYAVRSSETLGRNTLRGSSNIIHISVISTEKTSSFVRLSTGISNIRPYRIISVESLGLHTLSTFKSIIPYRKRFSQRYY
jgi:hypothetical protein